MKRVLAVMLVVAMLFTTYAETRIAEAIDYSMTISCDSVTVTQNATFNYAVMTSGVVDTLSTITFANLISTFNGFKINSIKPGALISESSLVIQDEMDTVILKDIKVDKAGVLIYINLTAPSTIGMTDFKLDIADYLCTGYSKLKRGAGTITVKARSSASSYTLSFDPNGGTGSPDNMTKNENSDVVIPQYPIPTRTGYTFKNWVSSSGKTYYPGDIFSENSNTVFTAQWERIKYDVVYDNNGGVGGPDNQYKYSGEDLKLSPVVPTKTGYKFMGWDISSAATTVKYNAGDTYKEDAAIKFYAVWQKSLYTYKVTFNANGGTDGPAEVVKNEGTAITLPSTKPTREGYSFVGWGLSADATSVAYNPGDKYSTDKDLKLYAIWKKITYTIKFDANGGTGAPNSVKKEYNVKLSLPSDVPTKNGYSFVGWNKSSTATTATYKAGGTYSANASVTLYAVWQSKKCTVKFDANGGTGGPASMAKYGGVDTKIPTTKPSLKNYVFMGWGKTANATTVTYKAGATYKVEGNRTLYAVYASKIQFNANGGSGAPATIYKMKGVTVTLPATKPTRTGYTFLGWAKTADTTTATFKAGGQYSTEYSRTLYAVWKSAKCTVKFDANGGTGGPASMAKYGGVDTKIPTTKPALKNYVFIGWGKTANATTVTYKAGATYKVEGNRTLFAVYASKIQFNANGGSGAPATIYKVKGIKRTLPTAIPTRKGYTFLGWAKTADATTAIYKAGGTITAEYNRTLYAVWKKN